MVAGSTAELVLIRNFELAQGVGLPEEDWNRGSAVAVIGNKIREEMFGNEAAVGQLIRVDDRRLRVIGVLRPVGQGLGMNTDELVSVPVALAQAMFNSNTLFRILVEARSRATIHDAKDQVMEILKKRHRGEEDVTVITLDAVLSTFDKLLRTLTLGVAGIAAISLAVAGILVMNVMLVAVTQRTGEIGLLKALGAFVLRQVFPVFPAYPPDWAVLAGLGTALGTGLLFSVMPARRAARFDPVQALMKH